MEMSESESITVMLLFHFGTFHNFKHQNPLKTPLKQENPYILRVFWWSWRDFILHQFYLTINHLFLSITVYCAFIVY
jgi:hypothetical protein